MNLDKVVYTWLCLTSFSLLTITVQALLIAFFHCLQIHAFGTLIFPVHSYMHN